MRCTQSSGSRVAQYLVIGRLQVNRAKQLAFMGVRRGAGGPWPPENGQFLTISQGLNVFCLAVKSSCNYETIKSKLAGECD